MAPKAQQTGPEYVDEHHQRISEFAADYFDDDDERESFVDTLMERRGYQRRASWALPDPTPPDPGAGNGDGGQQTKQKPPYFRR